MRRARAAALALAACLAAGLARPGAQAFAAQDSDADDDAPIALGLPEYEGPRKRVAVLDFQNESDLADEPKIGRGIAEMMTTALLDSMRFRVVERGAAFRKIMEEQKLSAVGAVDSATAVKMGKLLGAESVIVGRVTEFGIRKTMASGGAIIGFGGKKTITTRVVIDARVVDTETGEVLAAATGQGASKTTRSAGSVLVFSVDVGTEGFDDTTIGKATRRAVYEVVRRFCLQVAGR